MTLETSPRAADPLCYSMYGLIVASDIRLPTECTDHAAAKPPDVVFRRMQAEEECARKPDGLLVAELRCYGPCHRGQVYSRVRRGPRGSWVTNPGVATCFITSAGTCVDVYPDAGATDQALGLLLAGEVSTLLLLQRGRLCLHASAVVTERGAIAFLGPQGRGKSTMAACFLRHGAALLTDDILALTVCATHVEAAPGLPMMKLWQQAVQRTLELDDELPDLGRHIDKKLLTIDRRYAYADRPAPLQAMYLLGRHDSAGPTGVIVRRLAGQELLTTLVAHTSHYDFLLPVEAASLLRTYSQLAGLVSIRALRFPDGFEHQDAVYDGVLQDLVTL